MSAVSRFRHSFAGKLARFAIHRLYQLRHADNKPVTYRLPGNVEIELYPEGEIAEFLDFKSLFEQTELSLVARYLTPGMKMIDVGANIGLYSIFGQKLVGETGTVWSFEPSLETFQRLERNLALNHCGQVKSFRIALSDREDASLLLKNDKGFGDAYRYLVADTDGTASQGLAAEPVRVTTLDQWTHANHVAAVDFLKIDVEGGEYRMLLGARCLLQSSPDLVILFESDPEWCERAACRQQDSFEILKSLGFRLHAWNRRSKQWSTDERLLLKGGMIWACANPRRLP